MNEKLQDAMDGDPVARAGLDARDAALLAETEDLFRRVVRSIPAQPLPDLSRSVLSRIDALPGQSATRQSVFQRITQWLWSPRPVSLQWRPAYAFALVLLLAALPLVRNPASTVPAASRQVLVQFRLDAPGAQDVQLAGNFTNWKAAVAMKRTGTGVWTVVLPLDPGVHNYAFVVDGKEWIADPMAPSVSDGFGGRNSQLAVLAPDQGRAM